MADPLTLMPILIIDDDEGNIALLRSILAREGHVRVHGLTDPRRAVDRFRELSPDLLIVDVNMPHVNGLEVLEALRPHLPTYLPILMLTADERPDVREKALASGARDFLAKPVTRGEVLLRIGNLLEARSFHRQLEDENERLEARVEERTRDLERAHVETLSRLARAAEYRDDRIGRHVWRVARISEAVARHLGCDPGWRALFIRAARLHDVGKIAIPDGILLKPGPLTPEEFEVVKTHPRVGGKLLSGGSSPLMRLAASVALHHHERWDGFGYPAGLAGESIPLEGRIVAVADGYDAMTHVRSHRSPATPEEALAEIEAGSGSHFDPEVVAAFRAAFENGELDSVEEA